MRSVLKAEAMEKNKGALGAKMREDEETENEMRDKEMKERALREKEMREREMAAEGELPAVAQLWLGDGHLCTHADVIRHNPHKTYTRTHFASARCKRSMMRLRRLSAFSDFDTVQTS